MKIPQTMLVAISLSLLSAAMVWAADSTAEGTAGATAPKTDPTAATTPAAAGQGGAAPIKDAIVGSWKSVDDAEVMEFSADGNARIVEPNAAFVATYNFLEDGRLQIDVPVFKKQKDLIYKVEIKGDQLTMIFADQKPRTYNRQK